VPLSAWSVVFAADRNGGNPGAGVNEWLPAAGVFAAASFDGKHHPDPVVIAPTANVSANIG